VVDPLVTTPQAEDPTVGRMRSSTLSSMPGTQIAANRVLAAIRTCSIGPSSAAIEHSPCAMVKGFAAYTSQPGTGRMTSWQNVTNGTFWAVVQGQRRSAIWSIPHERRTMAHEAPLAASKPAAATPPIALW
jgi:hypothetical protein